MNTTEISKEALEASEREIEASMGMRVGEEQGYFVQQAIDAATAELREQLEHALNPIHTCGDQCQRPACVLRRENEQLRQQVHDLCHDKHTQGPVTPEDFCDGCEQFQKKLFGRSPITELKAALAALTP